MTDDFVFDEKEHAYFLNGKPLHGITTVLGVIGKPALIQWAANQACEYVEKTLNSTPLTTSYNDLNWDEIFKEARYAHRKKKEDAAEKGTDLHALVEAWVLRCISENGGNPVGCEEPLIFQFTNWAVSNKIKFLASEQRLYSKTHWTAGTCDLVFEKDGKTFIGDIKTYKKIWDRVPFFQCAAYGMMWEEMYPPMAVTTSAEVEKVTYNGLDVTNGNSQIDGYCVLRLSKDGSFEALWSFDVAGDRSGFLAALTLHKRLAEFKEIQVKL